MGSVQKDFEVGAQLCCSRDGRAIVSVRQGHRKGNVLALRDRRRRELYVMLATVVVALRMVSLVLGISVIAATGVASGAGLVKRTKPRGCMERKSL